MILLKLATVHTWAKSEKEIRREIYEIKRKQSNDNTGWTKEDSEAGARIDMYRRRL